MQLWSRTLAPWLGLLGRNETPDAAPLVTVDEGAAPIDRLIHAMSGRLTLGISPATVGLAFADWYLHMAAAPGKQLQLGEKALRKLVRLWLYSMRLMGNPDLKPCIEPLPQDNRFRGALWQQWPYAVVWQSFLLVQQLAHNATTGVRGVSAQHERMVSFVTRQLLDMAAPTNFLPTNPELLHRTLSAGGQNFVRGFVNFIEDWERAIAGRAPVGSEAYAPGKTVAITPGQVVYRNRLIELIQYSPTTETVASEPLLIVPAWIMKYYILDLSPENSFVRYLVSQGFTLFVISWLNPQAEDRDIGFEDYLTHGLDAALAAIARIVPGRKVHALGYCLGGTLLTTGAARLARDGGDRLQSVTLLAAETDFRDAGELTLFIDEGQLAYLEDIMWNRGFLDTKQMAGAFQLLRSNDLVWSRNLKTYLMGEREPMNDLMAWNADATRLPYRMHTEYLHQMFLENALAEGRFLVGGRPVTITDIRTPLFVVGTEADHVAPWRSVFRIHLLADTDVTFLLASGGHNAGIVSEPGHPNRHYRMFEKKELDSYRDPDLWLAQAPYFEGSWWPAYAAWLQAHSSGSAAPPALGAPEHGLVPLAPAPGTYVLRR